MAGEFQVSGQNSAAPFTLKLHRGDGMALRNRRIAVSYVVEALRIFDHYHFRVSQQEASRARKQLVLAKPPRAPGERPWWSEHYTNPRKIRDRELFA